MSALFQTLVEQLAAGRLSSANLITMIQAGQPYAYQKASASFKKNRPGSYAVTLGDQESEATSPVEAKLMILDYLAGAARRAREEKAQQN